MEIMNITLLLLCISILLLILFFFYKQQKYSQRLDKVFNQNRQLLESVEKYVEIFNEHNVKELTNTDNNKELLAAKKIERFRNEYRSKLKAQNDKLTDEHEMLIDFVTLTLSLLIKTPPNLRKKIIDDNTDNDVIKKILSTKLSTIENHYIPVSLLEIAMSRDTK